MRLMILKSLYKKMGIVFRGLDSWSYYVLTSYLGFEKLFGRVADKKRKLYNGKLLCNYYQYFGPTPPKRVYYGMKVICRQIIFEKIILKEELL